MERVAIYARQSKFSETGASIENQITECKDYLKFKNKLDTDIFEYKDEGYSGKNIHRPDFQRMMEAVKQDKIDIVICYKLDRISRNLLDFIQTNNIFKKHNVAFIAKGNDFDTTTAMGDAMLKISVVFAEMERLTIAERITDNMNRLAETGIWLGGVAPLGYKILRIGECSDGGRDTKYTILEVDDEKVEIIKTIYEKYLAYKSMKKVMTYLLQNGIKTQNNKDFDVNQIATILSNPAYVKANDMVKQFFIKQGVSFYRDVDGIKGLTTYNKTKSTSNENGIIMKKQSRENWKVAVGYHNGIIEANDWLKVQYLIEENKKNMFPNLGKSHNALLTGIIRCGCCDARMLIQHGHVNNKTNEKTYYYVCKMKKESKGVRCQNKNIKVSEVDAKVLNEIKKISSTKAKFINDINKKIKGKKKENPISVENEINKEIERRKKLIDKLLESVGDENAPTKTIFEKVNTLQIEIDELESKKTDICIRKEEILKEEITMELAMNLLEKCKNIDIMEFEEKKELINALFTKITWDSEKYNIGIQNISTKKN